MRSIRSYLLSRLLLWAGVVLAASAVVVYLLVRSSLSRQFDQTLQDRIQGFASILFQVGDEVSFEFSEELMPEYAAAELPAYFQLWFEGAELLERSPSLGERDLVLPPELDGEVGLTWSARLPDGRKGRFAAHWLEVHHVYPEEGPDRPQAHRVLVAVARGRESLASAEARLLLACVLTVIILLFLLSLLARRTVHFALEPANRLARALESIDVQKLPPALAVGELPEELQPISRTSDALIRRVDQALERERRTTADIAHELRTPISELLTVAEVALRNGKDPTHTLEMLSTIRRVAGRMGETVATLLELARLESGLSSASSQELDAVALVGDLVRNYRSLQSERGVRLEIDVPAGARFHAPGEALRIVFSNLISNALHYAPSESTVRVHVHALAPEWSIEIANAAPTLEPRHLPLLTEPFWRKDRARADRNHAGLGLALSSALCAHVRLQLSFELQNGQLFARIAPQALRERA